jgi:glycosyltransferase involved in cell wall biosynthesis
VILTFVAHASGRPNGASRTIYEFANAMRRRQHTVHVVHRLLGHDVRALEDVDWFSFEDGIQHHFPERFGHMTWPVADFIFTRGRRLAPENGRPVLFVQGFAKGADKQLRSMRAPYPKVCVSRWLVSAGLAAGLPKHELVHVPLGLDHDRFRVVTPIEDRPLRIAMMYGQAPLKGAGDGLDALVLAKERVPAAEVVAFGKVAPSKGLPDWITYLENPPQDRLVDDVYNTSRIYLCPSISEGFGFPSVEAMACGCALVTTSNGGSEEFAFHQETALVSRPAEPKALANHIVSLLLDDPRRMDLARNGQRFVARFDWNKSAELLELFLNEYASSAHRYGLTDSVEHRREGA